MRDSIAREEVERLREKSRVRAAAALDQKQTRRRSHYLDRLGTATVPVEQERDYKERMAAWANPVADSSTPIPNERERETLHRAVNASLELDRLRLAEDEAVRQKTTASRAAFQAERADRFQKALDLFAQDKVAGTAALWGLAEGCHFLASRWKAVVALLRSEHDGADIPAFVLDGLSSQLPEGEAAEVHEIIANAGPWDAAARERLFDLCERLAKDHLDLAAHLYQVEEIEALRQAVMVAETPDAEARRRHQRVKDLERAQRQAFQDLDRGHERRLRETQRREARASSKTSEFQTAFNALFGKKSPFETAMRDLAEASVPPKTSEPAKAPTPTAPGPAPAAEAPRLASSGRTERTIFAAPLVGDPMPSIGSPDYEQKVRDRATDNLLKELRRDAQARKERDEPPKRKGPRQGQSLKDRKRALRMGRPP